MRHKLLLAILAVVLVGGSYAGYTRFAAPTAASEADLKTVKVDSGPILLTVSTTGNIIMPRQVKLTFGSSGTVNEVNVKQGRTVKKGDVLARLDTKNLQQAVDLAQANLLAAEDALQKVKEPYTAADLAKSKAAVQDAQAKLKTAQDDLHKAKEPTVADLAKSKAAVQDAQAKLDAARDDLQKAKEPTAADLAKSRAVVQDAQAKLDTARDDLQKAKEPTAADLAKSKAAVQDAQAKLDTARDDLQKAKEPTAADLAKARAAFQSAQATVTKAQEDLADIQNPYDQNDIANAEASVRQAKESVAGAESNVTVVKMSNEVSVRNALNALISSQARRRPVAEQEQLQQDLDLARLRETRANTDAQDALARANDTLRDAQANLDEIRNGPKAGDVAVKQGALLLAQANLLKAREDLDKMVADPLVVAAKESAVALALANLQKAREDLDKMVADPLVLAAKESAVALAQANLLKAREDLDKMVPDPVQVAVKEQQWKKAREDLVNVQDNLKKATLTAPFDGIVATVNAEEGLEMGASAVAIVLGDTGVFEVEGTVDEVDVLKVRQGQEVSVTLDALSGQMLRGVVDRIAPVATREQGVISYKINVTLNLTDRMQRPSALRQAPSTSSGQRQGTAGSGQRPSTGSGQRPPGLAVPQAGQLPQGQATPSPEGTQRPSTLRQAPSTGSGQRPPGLAAPQAGQPPQGQATPSPEPIQLREGLTAQLSVVTQRKDNVLRAPVGAVKTQAGRSAVQVMVDGKPQEREVTVGERNETWVEITEGLTEGDEIVIPSRTSQTGTGTQQRAPNVPVRMPGMGF